MSALQPRQLPAQEISYPLSMLTLETAIFSEILQLFASFA
jgi:hypothetical protein